MVLGIYCYIDKKYNNIVYVGKDSHIDEYRRHKQHYTSSNYNDQPINRIIQNNSTRYTYQVLVWNVTDQDTLNALETQYITHLKPKFNFTNGGDGVMGYKHSKESKQKMSEAKIGKHLPQKTKHKMSKNNARYWKGKNLYEETMHKISEAQNTTGFYRVTKANDANCKQGFRWYYQYYENNRQKRITSINLFKLEEKVKAKGMTWKIIDEKKAQKTLNSIKL